MTAAELERKYRTETYLADGVYVSFDGWHLILRAPREEGDHYIFIGPDVWDVLEAYRARLHADIMGVQPTEENTEVTNDLSS